MLTIDLYPFSTHSGMILPLKQVSRFFSFYSPPPPSWYPLLKTLQINLKVIKIKQEPLFFFAL